ncbi:unnamed protein product, partial [Amoebophrya sp. A120]
ENYLVHKLFFEKEVSTCLIKSTLSYDNLVHRSIHFEQHIFTATER